MARPRRTLSEAETARLAGLRLTAAMEVNRALSGAPGASNDLLGRIAWFSAVLGGDAYEVENLIEAALAARFEWREIATALGIDPGDRATVDNVARQHRRRRAR